MPITASCPTCSASFRVSEEYAGKHVKCPKCAAVMTIPHLERELGIAAGTPPQAPAPTSTTVRDDMPSPRRPPADEEVVDAEVMSDEPSRGPKLGSLAQAARGKQLKMLRVLLFIVGGIQIVASVVTLATLKEQVHKLVQDEIRKQGVFIVNPAAVKQAEEQLMRENTIVHIGLIILSCVYILFGFIVYLFPLPIAIVSLVLFVGTNITFMIWNPENIYRGIVLKILFLAALIKGIQAAIAHQREQAASRRWRDDEDQAYETA